MITSTACFKLTVINEGSTLACTELSLNAITTNSDDRMPVIYAGSPWPYT